MDQNATGQFQIKIEDNINAISKFVTTLKGDSLKGLSDSLRKLRNIAGEFEYWIDEQLRTQIEEEAETKVQAMIDAGFSFNSIVVEKMNFYLNDEGKIETGRPGPEDDDNLFS